MQHPPEKFRYLFSNPMLPAESYLNISAKKAFMASPERLSAFSL